MKNQCFIYKRKSCIRVSLSLHTKCNLNCDFCFEDKINNDIDIEAIKNIPKLLEENYPEELKGQKVDNIIFAIFGGELFLDNISDDMFNIYDNLCIYLITFFRRFNSVTNIHINFFTNGIHTKFNRIIKLFQKIEKNKTRCQLLLSYDPIGRFKTKEQLEMFKNTFWYFYNNTNYISELSIILSKRNINLFIEKKENFLDQVPKNILIDTCPYANNNINELSREIYLPSDDDLFNFYNWAIDNNKFQFNIIRNIIRNVFLSKNTNDPLSYLDIVHITYSDKKIHFNFKCELFNKLFNINFNDFNSDNKEKCQSVMNNYGCIFCEYKTLCTQACWSTSLSRKLNNSSCFLKRTIQYLYEHQEVKDRYKNFMEINCRESNFKKLPI